MQPFPRLTPAAAEASLGASVADAEAAGGAGEEGGEREIELLHDVSTALRGLPQPYKSTIYLRYYQDLGPREIAARSAADRPPSVTLPS